MTAWLPHSAKRWLWTSIALATAAGGSLLFQADALARAVVALFLEEQTLLDIRPLLLRFILFSILRALFNTASEWAAFRIGQETKRAIRADLTAALTAQGPAYTTAERTGELSYLLTDGLEVLNPFANRYLPQIYRAAILPLLIALFVLPRDWVSAAILLVTGPLIPFFMFLIGSMANELIGRKFDELNRMSAHFLDVVQGITTLKLFNRSRQQGEAIYSISSQYGTATMRVLRIAFLSTLVLELGATLSIALLAGELGLRMIFGSFELLPALTILLLAPEFYTPLRRLAADYHLRTEGMTYLERLTTILNPAEATAKTLDLAAAEQKATVPAEPAAPAARFDFAHASTIRFESVDLQYGSGRYGLEKLSTSIPLRQTTLIFGESGAGKSSLAALLLRFYAPTAGQIRLDERDMAEIPTELWREQVGWLPQRPFLFDGTLAANLRLAAPDATDAELETALTQASLREFIAELPAGLKSELTERGGRLSAGQRQRLALARLFLQHAKPIIILDEPTAHLDSQTGRAVWRAIRHFANEKERTVLIITHDPAIFDEANWIDHTIRLDHGRAAEHKAALSNIETGGHTR